MTRLLIFFLTVLLALSCSENEVNNCGSDSVEDIKWLKNEIEDNGYDQPNGTYDILIYKTNYLLMPVFILTICCPSCNTIPPQVKNCNGKTIGQLGVDVDYTILDNAKIIWRTHNGVCGN